MVRISNQFGISIMMISISQIFVVISNVIAGGTRVDLRPDATVVGVAQISSP
jgi:hypothetical protein